VTLLVNDPGIRGCGAARFEGDRLVRAAYVRNPHTHGNGIEECRAMARAVATWAGFNVTHVVSERQRIYTLAKQSKGGAWRDPNDLLPLAGVGCALAAFLPGATAVGYFPDEWGGQVEKEVKNARALERLTPEERACIQDAGALTHNILDAVGIGLHHLGRFKRRRVYAR
jgi:hypothetical protein